MTATIANIRLRVRGLIHDLDGNNNVVPPLDLDIAIQNGLDLLVARHLAKTWQTSWATLSADTSRYEITPATDLLAVGDFYMREGFWVMNKRDRQSLLQWTANAKASGFPSELSTTPIAGGKLELLVFPVPNADCHIDALLGLAPSAVFANGRIPDATTVDAFDLDIAGLVNAVAGRLCATLAPALLARLGLAPTAANTFLADAETLHGEALRARAGVRAVDQIQRLRRR